jgi:predicted nucleotidyltransferase
MNEKNQILQYIQSHFSCHTVILYGSRVGSEFRTNSDYDLLCIRQQGPRVREIIPLGNLTIDLIVDSEDIFERPFDTLYLWQSKILKDDLGFGEKLVGKNELLLSNPPEPLPNNRVKQRKKQILDDLVYIQDDSIVGNFRRHELLVKLRSLYLSFKCVWDLGDKHSFQWMKKNDAKGFQLFDNALKVEASFDDIKNLADYVVG